MQAVQVKMARAALGLSVDELASKAGVKESNVARLEKGSSVDPTTLSALNLFLSAQGIELIDSDGVRAKTKPGTEFVTVDALTADNDGGEG